MEKCGSCSRPIEEGRLCEYCRIEKMANRAEWWKRACERSKKVGKGILTVVTIAIAWKGWRNKEER